MTEKVAFYGLPVEVTPQDALIQELHRTAGHVAWLSSQIHSEERGDTDRIKFAAIMGSYSEERAHLARVAKDCISLGIEAKKVELIQEQGELVAQVLRGVLTDLGVLDRPETPAIVRKHLTIVAQGVAA